MLWAAPTASESSGSFTSGSSRNPSVVDPLREHVSGELRRQPSLQSLSFQSASDAGANPGGHRQGSSLLWSQTPNAPQSAYTSHCTVGAVQNSCQLSTQTYCLACPVRSSTKRVMVSLL